MPRGSEPARDAATAAAVAPPLLPHLRKGDLAANGAGFAMGSGWRRAGSGGEAADHRSAGQALGGARFDRSRGEE